ncbi:unnamed protein product [Mytilus coruscus]|uniref:SWIM-type domain-containing protein n=1 Tax=Mytilus coruscus TaxID=42192 RepID=A0A6J8BN39_MYTCO|nr:unnamed protein product [Mytilus coruscus]
MSFTVFTTVSSILNLRRQWTCTSRVFSPSGQRLSIHGPQGKRLHHHRELEINHMNHGCIWKRAYCAHCSCMAGLGEVCIHVGALLFKVEMAVKIGITQTSSTSKACQWNNRFRKETENLEVATRNQAISSLWYQHRMGRITTSKAHDVLVRKSTTPAAILIKKDSRLFHI